MAEQTLTAPLALIKVGGVTVGKMRDLRLRETYRRGRVSGIGELSASELPALEFNGTVSCDFYEVKFNKTGIPGSILRGASSPREFLDNVLLQDEGVTIVVYKKVQDSVDTATGLRRARLQEHLSIVGCFVDSEGMNLSEGQISGHSQEFTYKYPVLFDPNAQA